MNIKLFLFLIFIIISTTTIKANTNSKYYNNNEIIDSNKDAKVILIMAFKRMTDLSKCLDSIINSNNSKDYHLVITQSVSMNDFKEFKELDEILKEKENQNQNQNLFKSITHIYSESSSNQPYGNAYFAFKNLVHGLNFTISKLFPNLSNLIIFEEDVEVSKDVFEFFDKSSEIIKNDHTNKIKFATTAYFLHTTHTQYNWKLDKPIKRKSVRNDLSLSLLIPNQLDLVTFNGAVEFKVLSWMMERSIINQLILDFNIIENWVIQNNFEDRIENKPNSSKPELLVQNCDCWNHDRYIELRFKGLKFIGSQSPRCNHVPHGGYGLSSVLDDYGFPIEKNYIKSNEFKISSVEITGEKGIWNIMKEYLPKFECPSRIDCYNNQSDNGNSNTDDNNSEFCGSLKVSTCLNIWSLECVPCSGRHVSTLQSQCNQDFKSCCINNCTPYNPFFISLPSLH